MTWHPRRRAVWPAALFVAMMLALACLPRVAGAQQPSSDDDDAWLLRANADVAVPANATYGNVGVWKGNATVDGTVREWLVVVDGDTTIKGTVDNVAVVRGTLNLASTARVTGDVRLFDSTLNRAQGATVSGSIHSDNWTDLRWLSRGLQYGVWIFMTVVALIVGLIWAAVAGRQLNIAGEAIARQTAVTILVSVLTVIGLPIIGVIFLVTVLGIPIGLGIFFFVIPALALFGFVVTATRLGRWIVDRGGNRVREWTHPYLSAVVGIMILRLLELIPEFGFVVFVIATGLGAGAILVTAWSAWRHPLPNEFVAPPAERSRAV